MSTKKPRDTDAEMIGPFTNVLHMPIRLEIATRVLVAMAPHKDKIEESFFSDCLDAADAIIDAHNSSFLNPAFDSGEDS